jgi:hypothetical protein
MNPCSEECRTPVDCLVCGKRKCPVGRDPGIEAASGYCDWECPGYDKKPNPPHLWPGEPLGNEADPFLAPCTVIGCEGSWETHRDHTRDDHR